MTARRDHLIPLATALAPLTAGAMLSPAAAADGPSLCPLRAALGIPCPLCGATRAFALVGHGDLAAAKAYNLPLVVVAVLLALVAAAGLVLRTTPLHALATPRRAAVALAVTLGIAWAWTLAHADTILA